MLVAVPFKHMKRRTVSEKNEIMCYTEMAVWQERIRKYDVISQVTTLSLSNLSNGGHIPKQQGLRRSRVNSKVGIWFK